MRFATTLLLVSAFGLSFAPPVRAVVQDEVANQSGTSQSANYTTTGPPGVPYANVGSASNGSAVYLGNGWVLTAAHVNDIQFNFPGNPTTYFGSGNIVLQNPAPNSGPSDLEVTQLTSTPNLPSVTIVFASPNSSETIYNTGYGAPRDTAFTTFDGYPGYGVADGSNSSTVETWGSNTVLNLGTALQPQYTSFVDVSGTYSTMFQAQFGAGTDQIVDHDSGGGVFNAAGQLIGMNDAVYNPTDVGMNYTGTTEFGEQSYMIDVATYYSEIQSITGIPEPSSLALLTLGGIALLSRRRGVLRGAARPLESQMTL